jgi:F-type H+-transporting ATPase subunit delta
MTARRVARQYANALFDVAKKQGDLAAVARDLAAFQALVAAHPDLSRVLESPAVPPATKRGVVEAVLNQAGPISGEVRRLLVLMADRDRLSIVGDVAELLAARQADAEHRVAADVVTAVPMGEAQRAALAQALGRAVGREVTVSARVDPAIVGGLVAKVGGLVFDGSVTRQVERLRQRLLADV